MKWAFWRSETSTGRKSASGARAAKADGDADGERVDEAAALRTQARRRLIGAAVILLATAAIVPIVLDPQPRPLPESIPIEVRGDRTPFTPKTPLPVPDPAALQGGPLPDAASDADAAASAANAMVREPSPKGAESAPPSQPAEPKTAAADPVPPRAAADKAGSTVDNKAEAKTKSEARPEAKAEGANATKSAKLAKPAAGADARFAVQAAAPRSEQAARDLMAKLKTAGLPAYVERTDAADGARWRVRAGPFATRAEADRARARLRELGHGADLVAL